MELINQKYEFCFTDRLQNLFEVVTQQFQSSDVKQYLHHTIRVAAFATRIARDEKANVEFITAAAIVHDIGMTVDPTFSGHTQQTKTLAPALLVNSGYKSSEADIIASVAASHHPSPEVNLEDKYEQILFDADFLDSVGVLGFLRWFGGMPEEISELGEAAQLFLDVTTYSRNEFFYTSLGCVLGKDALHENQQLCKSIIQMISAVESDLIGFEPLLFSEKLYSSQLCPSS